MLMLYFTLLMLEIYLALSTLKLQNLSKNLQSKSVVAFEKNNQNN